MSHAREEIKRCSGSQFDPAVVDVFMTIPEQHWWICGSTSLSVPPGASEEL